ncbi:hypothetical protein DFH07DRAFT_783855 [Mycena maculata]|uniref:Uncharacterized protein n=1 Tax=Mycena maculata TaxID=230809 RepID=A0AAD7HJZ9_9AGAR|nr:hypothetical protein DFH07DRAFT_783855 [Mycena maculata]
MPAERPKTSPPRKPYLRSVAEPLWDINTSHDDGSPGLLAMLLTRPQLWRTREVQFPSDTCRSCGLLIAPLGYGAYRPAFHLAGELHPSPGCDVCKALHLSRGRSSVWTRETQVQIACCLFEDETQLEDISAQIEVMMKEYDIWVKTPYHRYEIPYDLL